MAFYKTAHSDRTAHNVHFSWAIDASPVLHCLKKWGTHIVPHRSHKNRALSIRFGTVNRKSILAQIDKSRETFIPEVALLTEDVDEVLPMISLKHVTQ